MSEVQTLVSVADRLRQIADVLARIEVEPEYVSAKFDGSVGIDEGTFRKMFCGESFSGRRRTNSPFVDVVCSRYGITWSSFLYSPIENTNSEATVTA